MTNPTIPPSDDPDMFRLLPRPGSPEASKKIDELLAEYSYPSNPKNAARAGFMAAIRMLNELPTAELLNRLLKSLPPAEPSSLAPVLAAGDFRGAVQPVPLRFPGNVHVTGVVDGEVRDLSVDLQVDPVSGRVSFRPRAPTN